MPQNEHAEGDDDLAIVILREQESRLGFLGSERSDGVWELFTVFEDFIDEAVSDCLFGGHVVIAIGIVFDFLDGFAGVVGKDAVEAFFEVEHEADGAFHI